MIVRHNWGKWKAVVGDNGMLYLVIKPIAGDDFQYSVPVWEMAKGGKLFEWIRKIKELKWKGQEKII